MAIEISKIDIYGWEAAIRGMRNSRQSWDKSDSDYIPDQKIFIMGRNDLMLASVLAEAGGSEAKFRRMIGVTMDILAPLYWWKEFDIPSRDRGKLDQYDVFHHEQKIRTQ